MSRLVVIESLRSAVAARQEWDVVMDSAHPGRGLDPAELLEKVGAVAASLARDALGTPVTATSLEKLEVLHPVHAGERLIITAAIEPARDGQLPISLVARRRKGLVVIAGVLRFAAELPARATPESNNERLLRGGSVPMETTFRVRVQGDDALLGGNLVAWVHASALVSAQGFAGKVQLAELQSLSLLGPVTPGETLSLQCSVVRSSGDKVTVLSLVRGAAGEVLAAVSVFRVLSHEAPLLVVG